MCVRMATLKVLENLENDRFDVEEFHLGQGGSQKFKRNLYVSNET